MKKVTRVKEKDVAILSMSGHIQQDDLSEIERLLEGIFSDKEYCVVIDLSNVKHICSTALGVLVYMQRRLQRKNGSLKFVVTDGGINNLLKITMLDRVFDIHESRDLAIKACRQSIHD